MGLKNGKLTCLQAFYLFLVEINAGDVVAQVSQHHPRIQSNIACSNDQYAHTASFLFLSA